MSKEIRKPDHVLHEIAPVYDKCSRVLVLGSFPSVKSREGRFFYHHPQNRFWKVLAEIFKVAVPVTVDEKRQLLLDRHVAVWDVIASCDICGSSDSSIKNVVPNDLNRILESAQITQIFCNGGKSHELYRKYCEPLTGRPAIKLPSTSPANAACNMERLKGAWQTVAEAAASKDGKEKECYE